MTTELDLTTNGNALAAPMPGTSAAALDMLRGHAEMMAAAHQLATAMVGTQMVPAIYRRKGKDDTEAAENAAAAILYGAELGLNPIQSLQQVFPIHGQPAIYARTMVALLKARGFRFRTEESTDTTVTVTGTSPSGETETATWTLERARRAGYTTNKKYETDPQAMLYAKACAEVCRKLAPDVLLGISHTREDLELEPAPEPVRATSERMDRSRAEDLLAEPAAAEPVAEARQEPAAEAPAEKPARHRRTRAKAAEPAPVSLDLAAQLGEARQLLEQLGADTTEKRLAYYRTYFDRPDLDDPRELSIEEVHDVIAELRRQVAAETKAGDQ